MEGFCRKKGEARDLLVKEKKGLFWAWKRRRRVLMMEIAYYFSRGWRGPMRHVSLLVLNQKIPSWLIKIMFLGEVEAAIRSGLISRFGIMGFSTNDAILRGWGRCFKQVPLAM